jgi:DNA-binding XRE family transcriptional regulator
MSTKNLKNVLAKKLGPMTFGSFLRGARASRDMSQIEMAKFLGISKSSLCDIEKGRQFVTPSLAASIAKKCKISVLIAVEASINDQLSRAGLNLKIKVMAS